MFICVMMSVENSEQYSIRDDSSGISKVEPRIYIRPYDILEVFYLEGDNYMKIIGSKYLEKNDYSNIAINANEIIVRKNKGKYKTMNLSNSFIGGLKALEDEGKINSIIDYFLDYHKVNIVGKNTLHGVSYVVDSSDGTSLCINRPISDNQVDKIYAKYERDRWDFVFSRNFYEYGPVFLTTAGSTGYMESGYIEDDRSCRFYLETVNGKITDREKEFLIDIFSPMLSEGEVAVGREEESNLINVTFLRKSEEICEYVDYGAPRVRVTPEVLPVLEALVVSHNEDAKNRENDKDRPKQLRMEELKWKD